MGKGPRKFEALDTCSIMNDFTFYQLDVLGRLACMIRSPSLGDGLDLGCTDWFLCCLLVYTPRISL